MEKGRKTAKEISLEGVSDEEVEGTDFEGRRGTS